MSSFTPSRRSVLRTAAWSAPVVAVAAAAPAFATSGATFTTVTTEPLPFAATYLGTSSLGTWTIAVTSRVPVSIPVGTAVPAPQLTAVVTVPASARDSIASLGVTQVGGTASAPYTVQGQPAPLAANLTIPTTAVPASGPIVIELTGNGTGFTANAAGTFSITLENIIADLAISPAVFGTINEVAVTLTKNTTSDYTLATFTVV